MTPAANQRSSHPKPRTLLRTSSLLGFYVDPSNGDIYAETNNSIIVVRSSGSILHRFQIPVKTLSGAPLTLGNANNSLVVDPRGGVHFFMQQGFTYDLVSLSASGAQEKDIPLRGAVPNGLFAWHDSSGNWAEAVVLRSQRGELISPSGRIAHGREPVPGVGNDELVTPSAGGGLLYTDGNFVHLLGRGGRPIPDSSDDVPQFGSSGSGDSAAAQTPGGPFAFDEMGGAVELGSTIYVADTGPSTEGHGIEMFTSTGIYEGVVPASSVTSLAGGPGGGGSPLYYDPVNGSLLFSDENGIEALSPQAVGDLVGAPAAATQNGFGDALGVGAGLRTTTTGGYFPAGSTPSVVASFARWWARYPGSLELTYSVASSTEATSDAWPRPKAVLVTDRNHRRLRFDLSLPPPTPGTYLVNADLVDASRKATIGSTCLTYSVGMPGDALDLSKLAPGADAGGPAPQRGVELAAELGTDDMREQLSLTNLLPRCNASAPSQSTCGPSALTDWASVDPETERAAAKATSLGVSFEVQVGQDDPINEAVVSAGYWGSDVAAIIEHLHQSAPDLRYVEAWNEPNTGPYSPAGYVDDILKPFYVAVQAANAADNTNLQVIGGTVVGMDVSGWWTAITQAGGLRYMNIAAIHPYPGFDRSFEEEGTPAAIEQLRALMARYGAGSMPIWVTEQGWWSDGEEAFYDVGNWAPREWMWLRSFGISNWNYFITEGQFSGYPTDFSLIEGNGGSFVKPGAMGLMTVSNLLGARPFLEQVPVHIPHAYAMLFGPPSNATSSNDVLAVWTDDLVVPAVISLSSGSRAVAIPTTGSLGWPGSLTVRPGAPARLELSGAPLYLSVPAGDRIAIRATKPFGTDFASASGGAVAKASSSASQENRPSDVVTGNGTARNGEDTSSTPAWIASRHDRAPVISVRWRSPEAIDRVIVATSSIASVLPGLRDYRIALYEHGRWRTVATVANQFFDRMKLVPFSLVHEATGVRIVVQASDYADLAGGLPPYFSSRRGFGQPAIYSIEAYGG